MVFVINFLQNVNRHINSYADPRSGKWFLISNPIYPVVLCLAYIYIVKILGPHLMETRKPFKLKKALIVYNLYQVIFNTWLFYEFSVTGWLTKDWSYRCQPMDYTDNPRALRMAKACWWFYVSKYIDFLDTIFFVLRKKNNQITKLHVIHHSLVPLSTWFGAMFTPGGHGTFCCFLNSFVHIVMYLYYFLAALGPKVQKYLWWKKYITSIQMIQFIAFMVHSLQLFFSNCDYPRISITVVMINALIFLFLFYEFYKETYKNNPKTLKCQSCTKNELASQKIIRIKLKTG